MPFKSRKRELQEFIFYCGIQGVLDPKNAFLQEDETLTILTLLEQTRYVMPRVQNAIAFKPLWWQLALFDPGYDEELFKCHFRMTQQSFWSLCNLMDAHSIFKGSREPVCLQLGVALYRMGVNGNGSSLQQTSIKFGIGKGSVLTFTDRVITVLLKKSGEFIQWPDLKERKQIGDDMAQHLLPRCIGFVDGSDVPLFCAPTNDKDTYWSRKKRYCLQFQIVCDPSKKIRDLYVGFPGSVHDARVYRSSPIGADPAKWFPDGEFLIGDSAYALTETVIVPFKRYANELSREQKRFNCHISSHRVKVEHTIGMLKGRFQSLRELRILICDANSHKRACEWVNACSVLHNFLLESDPWICDEIQVSEENEDTPENISSVSVNGQQKRHALLTLYEAVHFS